MEIVPVGGAKSVLVDVSGAGDEFGAPEGGCCEGADCGGA